MPYRMQRNVNSLLHAWHDASVQHKPLCILQQPGAGQRPVPEGQRLVPLVCCSPGLVVPRAPRINTQAEILLTLHLAEFAGPNSMSWFKALCLVLGCSLTG